MAAAGYIRHDKITDCARIHGRMKNCRVSLTARTDVAIFAGRVRDLFICVPGLTPFSLQTPFYSWNSVSSCTVISSTDSLISSQFLSSFQILLYAYIRMSQKVFQNFSSNQSRTCQYSFYFSLVKLQFSIYASVIHSNFAVQRFCILIPISTQINFCYHFTFYRMRIRV